LIWLAGRSAVPKRRPKNDWSALVLSSLVLSRMDCLEYLKVMIYCNFTTFRLSALSCPW
jgi:hypothetical protein